MSAILQVLNKPEDQLLHNEYTVSNSIRYRLLDYVRSVGVAGRRLGKWRKMRDDVSLALEQRLGREPTDDEIRSASPLGYEKSLRYDMMFLMSHPVSIETPINSDGDLTLADVIPTEDTQQPFNPLVIRLQEEFVRMDAKAQDILRRFYNGETQESICKDYHCTASNISQAIKKYLRVLRKRIGGSNGNGVGDMENTTDSSSPMALDAPTQKRTRIVWTEDEAMLVANEFLKLRCVRPFDAATDLIKEAQRVIPEDRQRSYNSVHGYGETFAKAINTCLTNRSYIPQRDTTTQIQEPKIVTVDVDRIVEVPKPVDAAEILKNVPGKDLLQIAISKMIADGVEQVTSQKPKTDTVVRYTPPPVVLSAKTVPLRVLVWGVMGEQANTVQDSASSFANISIKCLSNDVISIAGHFDRVIIMTKFISHRHQDCAYAQVAERSNVIHVNGGVTELLRKLNDLNSLLIHL